LHLPRDAAKSQGLVDELKATGLDAQRSGVDARQEAEFRSCCRRRKEHRTDRVCSINAGSNINKPLLIRRKAVLQGLGTCVLRRFLVGREAARYMPTAGRGTIFFTGATPAFRGGQGFAAFSSAKFGLRAVAQAMPANSGQEYPRRASPDRRRGGQRSHPSAHEGGERD